MPESKEEIAAAPAEEKTPSPTAETNGTENGHSEEVANTNGTAEKSEEKKEEKKEDPPKEMRAIVLTGFGGFKGVKILKKPEPTLQAGEVLIRVKAW